MAPHVPAFLVEDVQAGTSTFSPGPRQTLSHPTACGEGEDDRGPGSLTSEPL